MDDKKWDDISSNYFLEILSPLKDSKVNPLFDDLKKIKSRNLSVIDLGCGNGYLLNSLSQNFKQVTGIDFSKNMVKNAKEKTSAKKNVEVSVADMKDLSKFKEKFDIAISINSILSNDISEINQIIDQIYSVLKNEGKFFAVLPSMEVYLFQAMLVHEKELENGKSDEKARLKARNFIKKSDHDFLTGKISFDGDSQKAFYRFELRHRFTKAGFKNIKIKKVLYPWSEFQEAGQGYFPDASLPWDWYISCTK